MGLLDRLPVIVSRQELRQLSGAYRRVIEEFYPAGPFEPPTNPDALRKMLSEWDSSLLADIVQDIQWERLGSYDSTDLFTSERRRTRTVAESRRLWTWDVVTGYVVQLWTDFGFGENVKVIPEDEQAAEVFDEFWKAQRNDAILAQDHIHELSENMLVDGELFLAYYISTVDGTATIREIDPMEVTDIITDPGDKKLPIFYRRQWNEGSSPRTAIYPDWAAFFETHRTGGRDLLALGARDEKARKIDRADEAQGGTTVVVQHVAFRTKGGLRGWPLMVAGAPWVREHRRFRENRASIAAANAMYISKIKTKGGSRSVDAVRARIRSGLPTGGLGNWGVDSNPPAPAGSTFLENEAATLEKLPLSTAAGDAKTDGASLLQMAGLGAGIFPHWLGEGDSYRLATATAMEAPTMRQFSRYKQFWSAQFRRMVSIVLAGKELYPGASRQVFENKEADVSTDRLVDLDLALISDSVSSLLETALLPYYEAGQVDEVTAGKILSSIWTIVFQALGSDEPEEIADPEGFGVPPDLEEARAREDGRPLRRARRSGGAGLAGRGNGHGTATERARARLAKTLADRKAGKAPG